MSDINEHFVRPFSNHKGLPELLKPTAGKNGKIEKVDGKTRFQYQPSDHPDYCNINKNYDVEEMLYTVNKQYFRSDEFDSDTGLLTVGCSHSYGIGLRDNEIYGRKLADMLNLPLWNLGVGGMGPDICLLLTKQFLLAGKKPKAMVMQWPSINRKLLVKQIYANVNDTITDWLNSEISDIMKVNQLHAWNSYNDKTFPDEHFKRIAKGKLLDSESWSYDFWLIREQLILLARQHNIPIVEIPPTYYSTEGTGSVFSNCVHDIKRIRPPWGNRIPHSGARDCLHHGAEAHTVIAEELYDLLDKEL